MRSLMSAAETRVAVAVFLVAALVGGCYLAVCDISTGPEYNVRDVMAPALSVATGHGLARFLPESEPVKDFLDKKTPELKPEDFSEDAYFFSGWDDKFLSDRYLLVYTIGLLWKVFGISWKTVNILLVILYGLIALLTYGIFRLGMNRTISVAGTALTMVSPVMLSQLPSVRDFAKAPFILVTVLFCGWILTKANTPKRLLLLAAAMGVTIGIGIGFRQDSIICIPPVLGFILVFAHGDAKLSLWTRLAACLLFVAALIPPAFPAIRMTSESGGNNSFYLSQGFALPCIEDLDLQRASYAPLVTCGDLNVHASIYAYGASQLDILPRLQAIHTLANAGSIAEAQTGPVNPDALARIMLTPSGMDLWSRASESAARQMVREMAVTFPADLLTRGFGSILRIIRNLDPICVPVTPNAVMTAIREWEAPLVGHLYHFGLLYVLLTFLVLSGASLRLAAGALLLVLYFFAYPSLEFQMRHAFHLNFASYWFPAFFLGFCIHFARRKADFKLLPAVRRMALFMTAAAILCWTPLSLATRYQDASVGAIMEQYRRAELEPLPMNRVMSPSGNPCFTPGRFPAFESPVPVSTLNALFALGLPVRRPPDIIAEYLVAEFDIARANPGVGIEYADVEASMGSLDHSGLQGDGEPYTCRYFFPVYHFTENFQIPDGTRVSDFHGLTLGAGMTLKAFYRVKDARRFPLMMNVWLPSDPGLIKTSHKLKLIP